MSARRPFSLAIGPIAAGLILALAGCQPAAPVASSATSQTPAANAADASAGIVVSEAWIRETPPNAAVAGGYLTLRSSAADRLLSVDTPAAASVEIHEMSHEGGMMRMRELADGVELPAGAEVTLKPGGNHLMFIDPVEPVRAGQSIEAKLRFANAPEQAVTFEVRPLAGDAPAADHTGH
ncbi:copper chaperone PCu(A)C [Luteimonas fraxinea]|uniref:Copper chaperone PCu(A)C n=1 Tax=Luteimonas fraxinea TaxID=2901869 RepID=A0ABS8UDH6_9GAMM|nr:copper chaperone PCu(A)C [Luteimonas fraxinea]MCD9096932.1 copper chaperone PCu(A)C [Luteimonas fraxinea]MCD9126753.1 copper chaperone PCu(A)C [Luteimonas fraxinea]UHH09726.1 copper chaperone PCu(A)C [Luteimonas fraxinea]